MESVESIFTEMGGIFCTPAPKLKEKLAGIKAYIFDWDGVFNNGSKNESGSSTFSEPDAMGTNLLRFNYWMSHQQLPVTTIISGEKNELSFQYAKREHLHAVYFKIANKIEALNHLRQEHNIKPEETAFVFDDVLDLSLAKVCGVRILVNRRANPLFKNYVVSHGLADYITANESGNFAVREACEVMIGLNGDFNAVVTHRASFSSEYRNYLENRQKTEVRFYTSVNGEIEEAHNV